VQKIAGLCKKVLCYDAYPANDWIKTIPNAEYVPMDQLFAESNIISIHVPLLPETHHLINKVYEDFTFVSDHGNVVLPNTFFQFSQFGKFFPKFKFA